MAAVVTALLLAVAGALAIASLLLRRTPVAWHSSCKHTGQPIAAITCPDAMSNDATCHDATCLAQLNAQGLPTHAMLPASLPHATAPETPRRLLPPLSTHVELQNVHRLSTTALRLLSTISHLQHVDLDGSAGFSAEGVRLLYKLPRLEDLSLRDTAVSDDALIGIGEAKSLARLYLSRTQVTDAGLLHIAAISSLNTLSLLGCLGVTGIGMVHVGRLGGLEWLYLQGTGVDDAGLHNLAYLTKLHVLYLPGGECVDHEKLCRQVGR
ncbi:unnamed protein product [Closterium sp. NIES-53]